MWQLCNRPLHAAIECRRSLGDLVMVPIWQVANAGMQAWDESHETARTSKLACAAWQLPSSCAQRPRAACTSSASSSTRCVAARSAEAVLVRRASRSCT